MPAGASAAAVAPSQQARTGKGGSGTRRQARPTWIGRAPPASEQPHLGRAGIQARRRRTIPTQGAGGQPTSARQTHYGIRRVRAGACSVAPAAGALLAGRVAGGRASMHGTSPAGTEPGRLMVPALAITVPDRPQKFPVCCSRENGTDAAEILAFPEALTCAPEPRSKRFPVFSRPSGKMACPNSRDGFAEDCTHRQFTYESSSPLRLVAP